jgi:hypothetical protein
VRIKTNKKYIKRQQQQHSVISVNATSGEKCTKLLVFAVSREKLLVTTD